MTPLLIDCFADRYRFLSNFQPSPIVWRNTRFKTVEHAFQAEKLASLLDWQFPGFSVLDWHSCIVNAATPAIAKLYAREAPVWRYDWKVVRVDVMRELLRLKFVPGRSFAKQLLATGDALLVEGNDWHDVFWGCCYCERHGQRGENVLGKLLMERREELHRL